MSTAPVARQAIVRALLVGAALVVAAWLAISLRNERLQVSGIRLMAEQPPQAGLAMQKFERASQFSASQQPELFEASAYFAQGKRDQAIVMLRGLLAAEPDNRSGWLLLSSWLRPTDPQAADAAAARAKALDGRP